MAKKSKLCRINKATKYSTQKRNRCTICGRPRGFMRMFSLCRICFRNKTGFAELPGVQKSSW